MVDLKYVKKRKRRKIAAIVSGASAGVLSVFVIVAFLGSQVGTFTVGLKNSKVNLTMSEYSDFREPSSYLRVRQVEKMDCHCYSYFKNTDGILDFTTIDKEGTSYLEDARKANDGTIIAVPYFKYTFFVKNIGDTPAQYDFTLKILQNIADPATKRQLDGLLRVIVFTNGVASDVYARSADTTRINPETGEENNKEWIDGEPGTNYYCGQAEPFIGNTCLSLHNTINPSSEPIRYTVLYWLEGHDKPDGEREMPREAKLNLGVEINAYENQEK